LFVAWKGVHWTAECSTPGEALALKQAMQTFFDVARKKLLDRRGKAGEIRPVFSEVATTLDR
jgi:hypothetical protein